MVEPGVGGTIQTVAEKGLDRLATEFAGRQADVMQDQQGYRLTLGPRIRVIGGFWTRSPEPSIVTHGKGATLFLAQCAPLPPYTFSPQ